jgi:hypothetical protein
VTSADVLQAIKGTDFPATREGLLAHAEAKRGSPIWTDDDLHPVLEFPRALPERSTCRNPSKLAEILGATHEVLEEQAHVPPGARPARSERAGEEPLAKGHLKPAEDVDARAREIHAHESERAEE